MEQVVADGGTDSFNRTRMELKLVAADEIGVHHALLTVPEWN